jgi:hypothetical protein
MAAPVGRAHRANSTKICGKPVPLTISEKLAAHLSGLRQLYSAERIANEQIILAVTLWRSSYHLMKNIDISMIGYMSCSSWESNVSSILSFDALDTYINENASAILKAGGALQIAHYQQDYRENGTLLKSTLLCCDRWHIIHSNGIITLSSGMRYHRDAELGIEFGMGFTHTTAL